MPDRYTEGCGRWGNDTGVIARSKEIADTIRSWGRQKNGDVSRRGNVNVRPLSTLY